MADINQFIPFILKWEGGFIDDPHDAGGATNMGVTLKIWKQFGYDKNKDGVVDVEDLKLIFRQDLIEAILKPHYWDRWQADKIRSQSIAHILVDWLWMSGIAGIRTPQQILRVEADGIVGEKTLTAVNNHPSPQDLFEQIQSERKEYIDKICKARPENKRFRKGWLNRLADIKPPAPNPLKGTLDRHNTQFHYANSPFRRLGGAIVLLLVLCCCFLSCKSTQATSFQNDSEVTVDTEKEIMQVSESQAATVDWTQSESQSQEASLQETIVIRFDTSIPKDTSTGIYPVKEIVMAQLKKGIATQSATIDTGQELRLQSDVKTISEQLHVEAKEATQSQVKPLKSGRNYWPVVLILVSCLFMCLFFYKKQ